MTRTRVPLAALVAAVFVVSAGCSGGAARHQPPAAIPSHLIPTTVSGGLKLSEYPGDRKAFADAGNDSLVADGKLWEIHQGHLLVGTLEAATVVDSVSLTDAGDRANILDGAVVGSAPVDIQVDGVSVAVASAPERTMYVWFGRQVFQVLQLDNHNVSANAVLESVIGYEQGTGLLDPQPLPKLNT